MSRRERLKALDLDRVLIIDRRNVELALAADAAHSSANPWAFPMCGQT